MLRVAGITDTHSAQRPDTPLEDELRNRHATRFLGDCVQARLSIREAVEYHGLTWNALSDLCGPNSLHFLIPRQCAADAETPSSLARLFGAKRRFDSKGALWMRDMDELLAKKMGLTWRAMLKNGITYELLRDMRTSLSRFESTYGALQKRFDDGIGGLTMRQLQGLSWDVDLYRKRTAEQKNEIGVPRKPLIIDV
ncbi:hypothetical protein CYMTET_47750 [Cymbomonas tetramitiformis]|uniref:Uncharacterized protein n=1 Tax=Cymbomonas tetramitiformis TaxID=36881 RepID=A0AAE0BTM7_9CHLO|nr:hypothetical protein CYMTET_47750 [Cymbomonas tetramitiformis]